LKKNVVNLSTMKNELFFEVRTYLENCDLSSLSSDRLALLDPLIETCKRIRAERNPLIFNCICTHNSRRSHLTQVWAQAAANYYGIPLTAYSGGTEATALYPAILETLHAAGIQSQLLAASENPIYALRTGPNTPPIIGFSKVYEDVFNPQSNFIALMTCSSADTGCPIVLGAAARFPLRYEDPKVYDGTAEQSAKYAERSKQIATEMRYIMHQLNNQ
jgi:arsenate reductase